MKNLVRCAYLNDNGIQCKEKGLYKLNYHGEGELYKTYGNKNKATWVRVYFCNKHKIK